jgi:hypothetical protein
MYVFGKLNCAYMHTRREGWNYVLIREQSIDLNNIGTNGKILQTKTKETYLTAI